MMIGFMGRYYKLQLLSYIYNFPVTSPLNYIPEYTLVTYTIQAVNHFLFIIVIQYEFVDPYI